MPRRPHEDDISVGPDRWITYRHLAGDEARAVPVDPLLASVRPFVESLETECLAACCGIHAFALWPSQIATAAAALSERELEKLVHDFAAVQNQIEQLPSDMFVSDLMNQYFRKAVLLELLAHLQDVIKTVHTKATEACAAPDLDDHVG